jgi:hypothetical protein
MADDMNQDARAEMQSFLHSFADEVIGCIARLLSDDDAYSLLQGLDRHEWDAMIGKILTGSIGRPN